MEMKSLGVMNEERLLAKLRISGLLRLFLRWLKDIVQLEF
jgi:hypothetical protein